MTHPFEPYNSDELNTLVLDEEETVREEDFSEPEWLDNFHSDLGVVDEEMIYADMLQRGAGDSHRPESVKKLGTHVEEFE